MKAYYRKYILEFKRPGGTSRGIMTEKETWFLVLEEDGRYGIGECGLLRGLSSDDVPGYESKLQWLCRQISAGTAPRGQMLTDFPSIRFGLEQALRSLAASDPFLLFPSDFTGGIGKIPINGLIWMGDRAFMTGQLREKLDQGFRCIKLKIGALDFETELAIIKAVRKQFTAGELELRVDANGAFQTEEALEKLKRLSEYHIHSIEQPIRHGQWEAMAELCADSPIPVALDEELIGVTDVTKRRKLLQTIQPRFLVLKPSLLGGYGSCEEWIELAENSGTNWWITSALESNVGLNAIAQWTFTKSPELPQGLGTGSLFTNNFRSPLRVSAGSLSYNLNESWTDKILKDLCI